MATNVIGTLYTLHFNPPYKQARHYEGWTQYDVQGRLAYHVAGKGSKLVRAAVAAGCEVILVHTQPGTRNDERRLKNQKNAPKRCPICRPSEMAARREKDKARRRRKEQELAAIYGC